MSHGAESEAQAGQRREAAQSDRLTVDPVARKIECVERAEGRQRRQQPQAAGVSDLIMVQVELGQLREAAQGGRERLGGGN